MTEEERLAALLESRPDTDGIRRRSRERLARREARAGRPIMCAHCGRPQQGSASVERDGVHYDLCHPDTGLDCYHLVTVYNEPIGSRKGAL